MKNFAIFLIWGLLAPMSVLGGGNEKEVPQTINAHRKYTMTIHENDNAALKEFNRGLTSSQGNRSFISDVMSVYRNTFNSQVVSVSSGLIDLGISAIKEVAQSKRPKWENAIKGESKYTRELPMRQEILDFYKSPSINGPLDPTDMLFSGFGCRQYIEYYISEDSIIQQEVFNLRCKVRVDSIGMSRMINHSKFEVYVDYLSFNPALCNIPNDSLGVITDKRIGFSFEKRKDLKFRIKATILSSWINQAMMVFNNQILGSFDVVAEISPNSLNEDGVFVYSHDENSSSHKHVRVTGDSFLVPRSYTGTNGEGIPVDSWGTGQYKVEFRIEEMCSINTDYYMQNGRWDRSKWKPEWKIIKSRKPSHTSWGKVLQVVGVDYMNGAWVTTLSEPIRTCIVQEETEWLNRINYSGAATVVSSKQPVK